MVNAVEQTVFVIGYAGAAADGSIDVSKKSVKDVEGIGQGCVIEVTAYYQVFGGFCLCLFPYKFGLVGSETG